AGARVLERGGTAVDAVESAVVALEEDPLFNAGRGAVLAADGSIELDAAVMDGRDRRAGAVACVTTARNPIKLARAVMDHTPHVLLIAHGAEALARELGLERVDPEWFRTPERAAHLADVRARAEARPDVYGTVGAVALDQAGHLAAATSTGGTVNKRPGRVGDSPIVGAGTFAWDETAAVSATGHGEPFIRLGVAARVSAWIEIGGLSLDEATARVMLDLEPLGGRGGLIAVDRRGRVATPFNTAGMFRGWQRPDAPPVVAIW
ncbi:MAG: isoaspartyl peptidase/L-asparaginase, partial [Myxococcota bacterium]